MSIQAKIYAGVLTLLMGGGTLGFADAANHNLTMAQIGMDGAQHADPIQYTIPLMLFGTALLGLFVWLIRNTASTSAQAAKTQASLESAQLLAHDRAALTTELTKQVLALAERITKVEASRALEKLDRLEDEVNRHRTEREARLREFEQRLVTVETLTRKIP